MVSSGRGLKSPALLTKHPIFYFFWTANQLSYRSFGKVYKGLFFNRVMVRKHEIKILKENEQKIEEYLEFKKTSVSDQRTFIRYRFFLKVLLSKINKPTADIQEPDIIGAINKLSKSYKVGSMNDVKILMKSFLYWRYDDLKTRFRNLDKICTQLRKERTYAPDQMLSKEDIEKLVKEEKEPRWKAFFLLLFYGGFRPSEVCNLEWKNIIWDENGAFIKVYVKKNGKSFEKYIPEDVCFYLEKLKNNNSKYVFPTKRTKMKVIRKQGVAVPVGDVPMTRSGVYQHLLPLAKKVLNRHINPYILRHSIATILYNRDDLKDDDVAKQMGHSKNMKETYNNLSMDKIRERMKKIYIEAEDLPEEKKHELEQKIERQEKDLTQMKKHIQEALRQLAYLVMHPETADKNLTKGKMKEQIEQEMDKLYKGIVA